MALSGTLGDFSLTDILQLIGLQRKTGVLVLRRGIEEVTIGFDSGRVVSADSSRRASEQKVGQLLVRTGKLSEERLEEALRRQRTTLQRLGHVLVEAKWVDKETVRRQLLLQITDTVYDLFRWNDGEYDFQPGAPVEWDRGYIEPIPAENLLMEGARMVDEWPLVERVIPSRSVVLRATERGHRLLATTADSVETRGSVYDEDIDFGVIPMNPLEETGAQGTRLSDRDRAVLRWVDGARSAGEIAELSGLGTFDAFHALAELCQAGMLETVEEEAPARGSRAGWGLLRSAAPARALLVVVAGLAALGGASALLDVVAAVLPGAAGASPLPSLASDAVLADAAGLERLRRAVSAERLARLEEAAVVYFLDEGSWPVGIPSLVQHGLVPPGFALDPWGRPYQFRVLPWGLRIGEAPHGGRPPAVRERRFSPVERTGDAPAKSL